MQKQTSLPGYNSSKTATKWKLAWRRRLCCWTSGDPVTRKMGFFSTGHRCQSWSCDTISRRYQSTLSKVFSGLVCMEAEYEIKLTTSHKPFNQTILRRFPIPLFPKVKEEMARMEVMGVTEKVDAPTEWYSPAVVVPKFKWKSTDMWGLYPPHAYNRADPWEAGRRESYLQARRKQWLLAAKIERQVKAPYHIHNLPGSILLNASFIRDFLRSGALSKEHAMDLRGSPGCRVSDGRYHRVWYEPSRARRKAWNCPY